jgi:hypothetical protein
VGLSTHQLYRQSASVIGAPPSIACWVYAFVVSTKLAHASFRTIMSIVGITIVLAVASFGVNEAEGGLMQRLAPRSGAELSLGAGSAARPTDAQCAYVGPATGACQGAGAAPNPCAPEFQQVSAEAYDAYLAYHPQRQTDPSAEGVHGTPRATPVVMTRVCPCSSRTADASVNTQFLIPSSALPCPGHDPSLPAPDSCPLSTRRPH